MLWYYICSWKKHQLPGDHDGILDQDEFVNGIYELLHPTTAEGITLAARIAKGNLADVSMLLEQSVFF